jgi:cardiolipin synthase
MMDEWANWARAWEFLVLGLGVILAIWASGHAIVYKRDARSATLWLVFVWLMPLAGAVLYFLLGVNRIRRWAESMRKDMERLRSSSGPAVCGPEEVERILGDYCAHAGALARAVGQVADRPLLCGNRITPLIDGDAAFPAMLEAIRQAERTVTLATYIFDADATGREFVDALAAAQARGVKARVLIDATGARYSWPAIMKFLRRARIPYARFLPTFPVWRLLTMNLRNHRKILVVDGKVGFTGGMNIRMGHWLSRKPRRPTQDVHFRVEGPAVAQLQEVFAEDWQFTTGEALRGEDWFPPLEEAGSVVVRAISDGPDEDFDVLRWTLLAAISAARHSVRIATPYFLPESAIVAALNVAAMRGVRVEILLPSKSNLPYVHWASRAHWWQVLMHGCRIYLSPPPFDHSKLMVVDNAWVLLGSANWDPRSLRLNFELNLECYGTELAAAMNGWFESRLRKSHEVTLEEVDRRGFPARLRDGLARLFTPFL